MLVRVTLVMRIHRHLIRNAVAHQHDATHTSEVDGSYLNLVVAIFGTGFGAVSPSVASGTAASASQLSIVVAPVTATMGGRPANVVYAGLAPGLVGLYQINVEIPSGVSGPATQIQISVSGVPTLSVLPVR